MVYSLEKHFSNQHYNYLDYHTKQIYIEYIISLSKLCLEKEYNGNFPEYVLNKKNIENKLKNWPSYSKEYALLAVDSFLETIPIEFYEYVA